MSPNIPDPTLPRYPTINPRPFDIVIEPREFSDAGEGSQGGAFFTQYEIASGDDVGDTYLQGGSVTGGFSGSHTFPDYKVWDAIDGAVQDPGWILYVQVSVEAIVEDGVMLPGIKVIAGSDWGVNATAIPPNDALTISPATGSLYYEIGRWTETAFLPSGVGNLAVGGCLGNNSIQRA